MKAKKENKTYRITSELEKQRYLKEGYDIYDDEGNLLEYSPSKKIAYSAYAALQKEKESLKQENEALKTELMAMQEGGETDAVADKGRVNKRKGE